MLVFTTAQLDAWIAAFILPAARILGLIAIAPVFANATLTVRLRLLLGLTVAFAVAPALPPLPPVPAGSWVGLAMIAHQTLIGILLGFAMRLVFAAIDVAGEMIGLQMGLSFAVFYDPMSTAQTPVIAEFFSLLATLIFLALNGHLLMLSLLAKSFTLLPIATAPLAAKSLLVVISEVTVLFAAGVLLALPVVAALLIANIAMGVLSRVAPALNLFAVGFPVTLVAGFVVIGISLPYFAVALETLFDQGYNAMAAIIAAGKP